jgi:hypothetical protein
MFWGEGEGWMGVIDLNFWEEAGVLGGKSLIERKVAGGEV